MRRVLLETDPEYVTEGGDVGEDLSNQAPEEESDTGDSE